MKRFWIFFLVFVFLPLQVYGAENWTKIGNQVNNAFFFVVDKIIALQSYFLEQALFIGRIVFLIAVSSAALNYALTGTGLKENIIKILKATVFFFIVVFAYPQIIGGITRLTFDMSKNSIYPSVSSYFSGVGNTYEIDYVDYSPAGRTHIQTTITEILKQDNSGLFGDLLTNRANPRMNYTTVSPAAVFKIIFFLAHDCFSYADDKNKWELVPEFSRVLKGLLCAFVIIFTGIFALLEYLVCFIEFMLVATVGVILFPFSLWDGSKFLAEKFIGAIAGFFIKLLFCTIAIFLLLYGFVSLFNYFAAEGFTGAVDQIIFILFVCLLFFYICKSAPGIAQSLLTGSPSLNAAGAIAAVGGAVGAVATAAKMSAAVAKPAAQASALAGGAIIGGAATAASGAISSIASASSAAGTVAGLGGNRSQQAGAFLSSIGSDIKKFGKEMGLTKGILGIRDHFKERSRIGASRGNDFAVKHGFAPPPPPPPPPPRPPRPPGKKYRPSGHYGY